MAPSSSDMLTQELSNGDMDFHSSNIVPDATTQQQQQQQHRQQQQQASFAAQQPHQPVPPHSQPERPFLQLFQTDSYQPVQQPQHQQDSEHQLSSQYQSTSDTNRAQHNFPADFSLHQQQPQVCNPEHQYPLHVQHDTFANTVNSQPPVRSSPSPPHAQSTQQPEPNPEPALDPQFDIFEWYPKYQSCQRYFIEHAQQSAHVQAVAAFINVALPLQRASNPIPPTASRSSPPSLAQPPQPLPHQLPTSVSLIPYLRRLVVTGLDFPGVLHGFFGDDWVPGVGPLHEQERRNYLFAAKSGGWASVKKDYDMSPLETVPFMRPLQGPVIVEIEAAEKSWSEWLAMEDWMVGPRAPDVHRDDGGGVTGHQREGPRR